MKIFNLDKKIEVDVQNNLGCLYKRINFLEKSEKCFKKANELAVLYQYNLTKTYLNMSSLFSKQLKNDLAYKYALKALGAAKTEF